MRRLKTLHEQRNSAVHEGTDPGPRAVQAALETADELRNLDDEEGEEDVGID